MADRDGVEALSMRSLAQALDVVPMALYKHVADKEDLLNGMVDVVISEYASANSAASEVEGDWREGARVAVLAARRSVLAHPWVRGVIETRVLRTPMVLHHMEHLTQCFLRGGLSPDLAHHGMHVLGSRIWGFSPEMFNPPSAGAPGATKPQKRSTTPAPDPADYPGIMSVAADARTRRPQATGCDEDFEFVFALDLILDAVARLHDHGWQSPS